jgi:hypothetical protein
MLVIKSVDIAENGGLYCLNDLHKASGGEERHKPANWLRTQQALELVAELEAEAEKAKSLIFPVSHIRATEQNQILSILQGQHLDKQGTFVCKELVYAYATWVSPAFFLHVLRTYDAVVQEELGYMRRDLDERRESGRLTNMLQNQLWEQGYRSMELDTRILKWAEQAEWAKFRAGVLTATVVELRRENKDLHETIRQILRK